MGFFEKFEFDVSLISSTLELTRVEVLDRSRASLWRYSALFAIALTPLIEKIRPKGVATVDFLSLRISVCPCPYSGLVRRVRVPGRA
jgi:hypothetical protein